VVGSKKVIINNPNKTEETAENQGTDSSSDRELRLAVFGDSDFITNNTTTSRAMAISSKYGQLAD